MNRLADVAQIGRKAIRNIENRINPQRMKYVHAIPQRIAGRNQKTLGRMKQTAKRL